ncbi:hypothetical protein LSH36_273g01023 [Paralvinella palmiformis]|uniref:G-protein coupled receptors family 1 profile domain-containing protein n=1 Tax=Paralvinella palmiformis TaxID=53620 RepID=A0AAD9JKR5_9ANNE|nr:hypothetical protein LSH36_273g01023 [Paralvinella palmiformis]
MATYVGLPSHEYNASALETFVYLAPEATIGDDREGQLPDRPLSWTVATLISNGHFDNFTMPPGPPSFNDISIIRTVVLGLMFVFSFLGNTATLVQVYRRRKSTINLLILHLATADLVVTFFCNVTDAVWASTIQWYAGTVMCKLLKFLQVFGLYLSTYIIVIISLDRCYAILDPMSRNKAPKRVRTMIIVAWLCSILFALPQDPDRMACLIPIIRPQSRGCLLRCSEYGFYCTAMDQAPVRSRTQLRSNENDRRDGPIFVKESGGQCLHTWPPGGLLHNLC